MFNTLIFNAMEQITIKQKLDAIMYEEINGLKKVLDDWFSFIIVRNTGKLLFTKDAAKAPIISLYTEVNDTVQYNAIGIEKTDEGYCLELARDGHESLDSKYIKKLYLDNENTRWEFIPGELDRLTKIITEALHPEEKCYKFTDVQKEAIGKFNEALKELVRTGVFILPNDEDKIFYFSTAPIGCCFDSFDNLLSTGEYEKVADIDYHKLPCTDSHYDTSFDSDGISLVKKA